jgi:hypothetical protein
MNDNTVPTTRGDQAGDASPVQATPHIEKRPVDPSSDHSGNTPSASPPTKSLEIELAEMGRAWREYRSINDRDAVYIYLASVFGLVMRWRLLDCALKKSRAALRLRPNPPQMKPEAFSIMIFCTADPNVVDAKTRSKWSRVLRYAARAKPAGQRLTDFIKSNGGLNECARKFARVAG